MADRSYLAFFEAPDQPFEFKAQDDFDLHIALEVPLGDLESWLVKDRRPASSVEVLPVTRWLFQFICATLMDTSSN